VDLHPSHNTHNPFLHRSDSLATMAAPAVELTEALYVEAPAQVLDQQLPLAGDANASSAYGDHEAAAFEDDGTHGPWNQVGA
jgi:hypothetical protein